MSQPDARYLVSMKIRSCLAGAALLAAGLAARHLHRLLGIGAAYKAKVLCTAVFVSGRAVEDVEREDFDPLVRMIGASVDRRTSAVSAGGRWVPGRRAVFRPGLGCSLEIGGPVMPLPSLPGPVPKISKSSDMMPSAEPNAALAAAVDAAFSQRNPRLPPRTRAVVVVHHGRIVAERYAPGITKDTPLPGWSMAKSVTNALVGILVREGRLDVKARAPLPEWAVANDPRGRITIENLLRMDSGLAFDERSGPFVSDVNVMLLESRDAAALAVSKPENATPGRRWRYSSGTTNILSRIIRDTFGGDVEAYLSFPRKALFDRIGMETAILEPDASGTFVGSSFMAASARDWARFGRLYLCDGVWEGERILPPGWVSFSRTPSPSSPHGLYGAHFWTNGAVETSDADRPFARLPADEYHANGFEGQWIVIVPSRDLVIVRLGFTRGERAWDVETFVKAVMSALPPPDGSGRACRS